MPVRALASFAPGWSVRSWDARCSPARPIKLVAFLLALVLGSSRGLDAIGDVALVAATIALGYRLYVDAVEEGCRSGLAEENRITHLPSTAGAHTRFIQTILQALERNTDTNARAQEHDPRRRPPGSSGYG